MFPKQPVAHDSKRHAQPVSEGASTALLGASASPRSSYAHLADIYTSHTPPFSPREGPAHHRSVILRQRARRVGEVGKVGVNGSHRLDPIVEKLGVLIIRDLEWTSQALADGLFPLQCPSHQIAMQMGDPLSSIHQLGSRLFILSLDRLPQHCSPHACVTCLCTDDHIHDSQRQRQWVPPFVIPQPVLSRSLSLVVCLLGKAFECVISVPPTTALYLFPRYWDR